MRIVLAFLFLILGCTEAGNRSSGRDSFSLANTAVSAFSMQHFVDPQTGNITEKLSIPKNYSGNIYLAVGNIDKLTDKHLYVRFKFGYLREHERVVPAIISEAPSLTPGSTQPVLIFSLSSRPFAGIPLSYDLYDYNAYNFTSNVVSIEQSNRDKDLYCRGLRIDDDPTTTSGSCQSSSDKCLYGYAKIEDKGWYDQNNQQYFNLLNPQIAVDGQENIFSGIERYILDDNEKFLGKCLNDEAVQNLFVESDGGQNVVNFGDSFSFSGMPYAYRGPFKPVNSFQWEIKANAIWNSQFGLFQGFLGPVRNLDAGYRSLMFPRYSKLSIKQDVEYIGAPKAGDTNALQEDLDSDGKTYWMSGCNLRVMTKDYKNEHIGSCNISAQIEIFYREDGEELVVASSAWDESSKQVKLQLLQEGDLIDSTSILNPAYRTCSADSACASNECCFNGRCWSDSLVSQCSGNNNSNKPVDLLCGSDTECASSCCREPIAQGETEGKVCRANNPGIDIFCNKPIGETCIQSSACQRQTITKEVLIRGATNAPGDCSVRRCRMTLYSNCIAGSCVDRSDNNATVDNFNPNAPDCSGASAQSADWICEGDPGF